MVSNVMTSDAPICNLTNIPITNNGSEISADPIYNFVQIFYLQYIISQFYGQFSLKSLKFWLPMDIL